MLIASNIRKHDKELIILITDEIWEELIEVFGEEVLSEIALDIEVRDAVYL